MASEVDVINFGLTLLGESRIASLADLSKPAREALAIYDITRDSLQAGFSWSFNKARARLPALTGVPEFGFGKKYQLPTDCIRIIMVGDYYPGLDLTDYRGSPTEPFEIEGREILTDMGAPLNFRYGKRLTDTAQFHPCFVEAFGCRLAEFLAEPLTQSDAKRNRAESAFKKSMMRAVQANAVELPPKKLPDDEWLMARR